MRNGDFAVEVVPHGHGRVKELDSGHVLARPGQVYRLRLRNSSPLNCVVNIDIDGNCVTAGGLVLEPWSTTELERPIDASEDGRFTVFAEGNETVFGPDGGRDNPDLGLIRAGFRRELPRHTRRTEMPPTFTRRFTESDIASPARPLPYPPAEFTALQSVDEALGQAILSEPPPNYERAAGTGLTGHSDQRFVPIHLGPLESQATVIELRLVIGSEEALMDGAPRPLFERETPARPAARP
jgi:hypothetical protein